MDASQNNRKMSKAWIRIGGIKRKGKDWWAKKKIWFVFGRFWEHREELILHHRSEWISGYWWNRRDNYRSWVSTPNTKSSIGLQFKFKWNKTTHNSVYLMEKEVGRSTISYDPIPSPKNTKLVTQLPLCKENKIKLMLQLHRLSFIFMSKENKHFPPLGKSLIY